MMSFVQASLAQRSRAELPAVVKLVGLDLALPVLEGLHFDPTGGSGHQPYDFGWQHQRGKFSLLYEVIPQRGDTMLAPHARAGVRVVHNARNSEGDFIGRFRGGSEDLRRLGADWAYFWDYAPKAALGEWRRCYQASYYRAGQGMVNAFLLYNDEEYLHSDWVYVLPFIEPAIRPATIDH